MQKIVCEKGDDIVQLNYQAIDIGASGLVEIEVDPAWKDLKVEAKVEEAKIAVVLLAIVLQ